MTLTFPLSLESINLFLAVSAMILLVTSESLSPRYTRVNMRISRKRLKNAAMAVSILFLATLALRVSIIALKL